MDILPKFVEWGKQREVGRRKLNQATRYIALVLAFVQSIGITGGIQYSIWSGKLLTTALTPQVFVTIGIILTAGSMIVTWLREQITDKGIRKWCFYDYLCRKRRTKNAQRHRQLFLSR